MRRLAARASWAECHRAGETTPSMAAALIDPTTVLQLASIDRVDHEVPDATRAPQTLRGLASDSSAVAGVMGRDAEGVEVAGDHPAALSLAGKTLVDVADEIGCALVG